MKHLHQLILTAGVSSLLILNACSNDNGPAPEPAPISVQGAYILHEGAFGKSEASLSYYDFQDQTVTHEVYSRNNSESSLGAGANDLKQYGSKLYIAMTESNQVVVANAEDVSEVGKVEIDQPRSLAFYQDKAFVTSYSGSVFVIDTASLTIEKEIPVGRTPEEIVLAEGKLYVANSGWYDFVYAGGEHDNTVSVIDPVNLTEEQKIEVADNVSKLLYDGQGHVLAATADIFSPADFTLQTPGKLYVIRTQDASVDPLDFGVQLMATAEDQPIYVVSVSEDAPKLFTLGSDFSLVPANLFSGIDAYNALAVDAKSGNVWVGDPHDYSRPGTIYYWDKQQEEVHSFEGKLAPKVIAFKKQP